MGDMAPALPDLLSEKSRLRLRAISSARQKGLGEHISLPQLIVCGDQSAGKSSVLEGISGIPFPRQDGLCTRFATEIILQDTDDVLTIKITMVPHSCRERECKDRISGFNRVINSINELPTITAEAGAIMGLQGFAANQDEPTPDHRPAFGQDVLQVQISGPTGLHLSVVDLPGLIQVPSEEQTDDDVNDVHELVETYMENPRSIILAVVQAGNDISNQPVIRKCRKFDPSGERTIGIITKPDLINRGTEGRIALLARNEDSTKLKLGFFLLKNPSFMEMQQNQSRIHRETIERAFFTSTPWKDQSLDHNRIGVAKLRVYLQGLLDRHLEKELPKVRQELRALEQRTMQEIMKLGDSRTTTAHMRIYLSRLAMKFDSICRAALQGNYMEYDIFAAVDARRSSVRLRAALHDLNTKFAEIMRVSAAKRKVVGFTDDEPVVDDDGDGTESDQEEALNDEQLQVSAGDMSKWIRKVFVRSRGCELPGDYNSVFLAELFHEQSSRWPFLAMEHLKRVYDCLDQFVEAVTHYISDEVSVRNKLKKSISQAVEGMKEKASEELKKLEEDEAGQPITYNHYYTDNVQKARDIVARDGLKKAMDRATACNARFHISKKSFDTNTLLSSLQSCIVVNMDDQACHQAKDALDAYYKVARKTFVDNVCRQVIERHLVRGLPLVFTPDKVAAYSDDELHSIAGESEEDQERRNNLHRFHADLKQSLMDLLV